MLHLAIECSGITGSVALCQQAAPLVERQLPRDLSSVRSLAQAIDDVLATQPGRRVELLSVTHGPGSFTGLRTGLATAKMLALAWGIPVVPVDTLHAIALKTMRGCVRQPTDGSRRPTLIVPVLNAYRKQVFAAAWLCAGQQLQPWAAAQVVDQPCWIEAPFSSLAIRPQAEYPALNREFEALLVSGPGLRNYQPTHDSAASIAPEACWDPTANEVALLGWAGYLADAAVGAQQLAPNYVRESAAEEQARLKI